MTEPGLAVVCTINNSRDHTLEFVRRFSAVPGCHLVLFLDVPEHLAYFDEWNEKESLTLVACTEDYWVGEIGRLPDDMPEKQHTNIRKGASIARELGFRWCVSIDSDELILNLPDLISRLPALGIDADLLRLRPAELIHDQHSAFSTLPFSGRFFKYCLSKGNLEQSVKMLNFRLRWRFRSLEPITRRLFFGHTNGKTIFKLSAPITIYKQHRQFSDQRELVEIDLPRDYLVLHYDAMNYETWLAKWKRRISGYTRATAINEKRRQQTEMIARSLDTRTDAGSRKLFQQWYLFSQREIVRLKDAGIVFELAVESV